jgi:tRNA(Met) cytidine acetyltransferase
LLDKLLLCIEIIVRILKWNGTQMHNKEFSHWFRCYQQQALMQNERRLIVLAGDECWSSSLLKSIDSNGFDDVKHSESTWLIYGESKYFESNVTKQSFRKKLGSESDFVVFHGNLIPIDAFAGLSGTLVAGGVLFLLVNNMSQMKESLFYKRFFSMINTKPDHVVIEQNNFSLPALMTTNSQNTSNTVPELLKYKCVTQDQLTAVEAVIKVLKGKRNIPLVITADRGRGKSSAMAIACAELLKSATKQYKLRIIITAVDVSSLTVFFSQLSSSLPEGKLQNTMFSVLYGSVEFIPVDQLLKQRVDASLVLVDEAAAIPIYLLGKLLLNHSRLVFASTIHGYEGAGRGFTLKFQKMLAAKFPKWQSLHLHEPIRWGVNDPLESLVFEVCLLNAELPNINVDFKKTEPSKLIFKQVSAAELVANEQLLKQVFAVLVTAHYQTKPSDVEMLLDNKQVQLVCLLSQEVTEQQVIAVALLINEGTSSACNIKIEDINAVNQSKIRLRNNFAPQSLLTQCGIEEAFNYHYLRVMRIAVHPQLQQQGIGSYFIDKITTFSTSQGADFLASSFGATSALLSFWLTNGFQLARIGFSKDKASGEQSALVLKALSQKGETTLCDINSEFYRSFDYLLADEYKYLNTELVALVLYYRSQLSCVKLSMRDKANIAAYAQGNRQYSNCVFSLHLWLRDHLSNPTAYGDKDLLVFISRIMQKQSTVDVCNDYGFTGKRDLEQFLKTKVGVLLAS